MNELQDIFIGNDSFRNISLLIISSTIFLIGMIYIIDVIDLEKIKIGVFSFIHTMEKLSFEHLPKLKTIDIGEDSFIHVKKLELNGMFINLIMIGRPSLLILFYRW